MNNALCAFTRHRIVASVADGATIDLTLRIAAPQLEQGSTATDYNPTTGTAYFAPRFDHDPATGASRGLLIEEARTNLFERSAELDNAYWAKTAASITANATTAPDGNNSADKLVENTAATSHFVSVNPSLANATTYTLSVFAKAAERSFVTVGLSMGGSVGTSAFQDAVLATFDLTNGTVFASSGSPTTTVQSVGNGWYRVTVSKITTQAASTSLRINTHNGTDVGYTGDGTSGLFIWGAQLEAGAFATSYIPTTTAAATRAADGAVVTPISSFYNQAEGTLFAEASSMTAVEGTRVALAASDGSDDNVTRLHGTSALTAFNVRVGGFTAAFRNFSAVAANASYKIIGAYKQDDFAASFNGGSASLDGSGAVPSVTTFSIGQAGHTGSKINGHIRKIAYWPRRLSNTLLQQLTT
jgi:hypothetical protein